MSSSPPVVTPTLDEAVKAANLELTIENKNLNQLTTQLHEKYRSINLMYSELKDRVESIEINNDDLKNRIDEVEFELNRLRGRELRLEENLTVRNPLLDLKLSPPYIFHLCQLIAIYS